eukprot:CAMPEP_0119015828 /NCGR_PEP_ID=MMETSP1176-20130426/11674_1 /TAXON_ID=265551 /ORGANISM="Synedropsis recta cf, Strain CCMP1620" /LENGTH=210 /DNA_ID=CAMNT_0006969151 /DNA_START=138 /DNA_END=770 /DNA_ORIENTATION=-
MKMVLFSQLSIAVIAVTLLMSQVDAFAIHGQSSAVRVAQSRLFDVEDDSSSPERDVLGAATVSPLGDEDYVSFPCRDYDASEVVEVCMNALLRNGEPYANAGLEVCWNFSSDRCRAAQGGSLEQFIDFADNPVFSSMVDAESWNVAAKGNEIPGTPTRGAMQTVLVTVMPAKGKSRAFLWTLQRERRPPRQDFWLVHECIFKDAAYQQTL